MDPWSLPKARPISCNDSPAFQRRHMSVLCSAESLTRLPCVINTTFRKMIHIRWCCIDRLNWHQIAGTSDLSHRLPQHEHVSLFGCAHSMRVSVPPSPKPNCFSNSSGSASLPLRLVFK